MKRVLAVSLLSTCLLLVLEAQTAPAAQVAPAASATTGPVASTPPASSATSLIPQVLPLPVGIPEALLNEALAVAVLATMPRPEPEAAWESRDLKYTIPGTAVSVKMMGSDLAVLITVTPYRTPDGRLLLVAQGQVWHKDADQGIQYKSTLDTINLAYGERVFFYPFGLNPDGTSPLRIELVVVPYRTLSPATTTIPSPASVPPAPPANGKTGP